VKRTKVDARALCPTGKMRYLSNARATLRLLAVQAMPEDGRTKPVRVYRCERCDGYHLTSQSKRAAS
jgi:hypothetical protein